jgi:hypothetical protein
VRTSSANGHMGEPSAARIDELGQMASAVLPRNAPLRGTS